MPPRLNVGAPQIARRPTFYEDATFDTGLPTLQSKGVAVSRFKPPIISATVQLTLPVTGSDTAYASNNAELKLTFPYRSNLNVLNQLMRP